MNYPTLKKILVLLFLSARVSSFCQEKCEKCDSRLVYVFDMAVHAPNPYSSTPSKDCDEPCMKGLQYEQEKWRNLHACSIAYKEALRGNGSSSNNCVIFNMKINDFMYPCRTPDLYIDSKSNNWRVTTIINSSDINMEPTYSALPPQPDLTDYLIYGILKYDTSANLYTAKVFALNFRKKEMIWESWYQTGGEGDGSSVSQAATHAARGDGHSSFTKDILPAYEKRKRDESNAQPKGIVALKGKLKFSEPEAEMEYNQWLDNKQEMEFTLIDCDDTPLKNKEVSFTVSEGSLETNTVTTDENGHGTVVFIAPDKRCKAELQGEWAFEYPSGKKDITTARAEIKVTKVVDKVYAQVDVKVVSNSVTPEFLSQDPEYSETGETNYSTKMVLMISRRKVERQLNDPRKRYECGKGTSCPVLTGSSYNKVYDPKKPGELKEFTKYPIEVSRDETKKAKKRVGDDTKFVTVNTFKASGTNQDEAIDMQVNIFYPSADPAILTGLVPKYLVSINGGRYTDKIDPRVYPTLGNGSSQSWDDIKETLVDNDTPLHIGIPYSINRDEELKTDTDVYTPMLIEDVKSLDQWLANPIGSYAFTVKGKTYHKDGNQESSQDVFVTVNLTPKLD